MKKNYRLVTNSIKNKYQCTNSIEYEPKFDDKFILSSGTKNPLKLVTVSLRGGKKHRATIIVGLTFLWDIRYTTNMIKSQNTKPYKRKMRSDRVEYSTDVGPYFYNA